MSALDLAMEAIKRGDARLGHALANEHSRRVRAETELKALKDALATLGKAMNGSGLIQGEDGPQVIMRLKREANGRLTSKADK